MPVKVFISLGYIAIGKISGLAYQKFTYAFKRKDGLVYLGGVEALDRKEAGHKIRRRHLLEFGEITKKHSRLRRS